MKILIVTEVLPPIYGGADIAALRYASYLSKKEGIEVCLLGEWNESVHEYILLYPFINYIKIPKWNTSRWRLKRLSEICNWMISYFIVRRWMNRNKDKFNIVHSFNSWANINLASLSIGQKLKKKIITETCLMKADNPSVIFKTIKKNWYSHNWFRKRAFLNADCYIAKSSYILQDYKRNGIHENVYEVPYFVDTKYFNPNSNFRDEIRKALGISHSDIVFLFVGGVSRRKNVNFLCREFLNLLKVCANIRLVLLGPYKELDSSYIMEFDELVERSCGSIIHCNFNSNDVNKYMSAADVYCLLSFNEGLPISILEALCTSLIVIASRIPEIQDVQIIDGINGFLVRPEIPDEFNRVSNQVITSLDYYKDKFLSEHNKAREVYSIDKVFLKYMNIYNL